MNVNYKDGVLTIDDGNVTFLEQPCWPNGTPWADETQAKNWAAIVLLAMTNPNIEIPGQP